MSKKKILIVDDEPDVLLVTEKRLTSAGYVVVTAKNGKEGLFYAKSQQPDLIVLDVQMPDMDGGEVAARLKEDPTTRDIPVVFLTCLLSSSEFNDKGRYCGGNIVLAKSNSGTELLAVIGELLVPTST